MMKIKSVVLLLFDVVFCAETARVDTMTSSKGTF